MANWNRPSGGGPGRGRTAADTELRDLVRRCASGDPEAQDRLYRRYAGYVRAIVRTGLSKELRRRYDSTDLQQSLFLALLRDISDVEFVDSNAFKAWLRSAAVHKLQHRRRGVLDRTGQPREVQLAGSESAQPRARESDPVEQAESAEEAAKLHSILEALPPRNRELVSLVTVDRCTFAEAATALSLPGADAARMRYARTLREIARAWSTT